MSDYVPFYFTPFSPMLYNIKTGYNGIPKKPMEEIVLLVSSLHKLIEQRIPFVFSDRHAYLKTALFSTDIRQLSEMVVWSVLQERNFRKDDLERFEKYQAETLVHKHVPISALYGIVCYNANVVTSVKSDAAKCGVNLQIISKPTWYL